MYVYVYTYMFSVCIHYLFDSHTWYVYVCVCFCMYVCMHACMYVRMYEYMYVCGYVCMCVKLINICMCRLLMHALTWVSAGRDCEESESFCMYVCMYVKLIDTCIYIYIYYTCIDLCECRERLREKHRLTSEQSRRDLQVW